MIESQFDSELKKQVTLLNIINNRPNLSCANAEGRITMKSSALYHGLLMCLVSHLSCANEWVNKKTIRLGGEKDEMGFTANERFKDIFELTEDNFEERVLDSPEPWIILFHNGIVERKFKTLAVDMRGIAWFGSIHRLEQEDLIDDIRYSLKEAPLARVYPWGSSSIKQKKWKDVESPDEAKDLVIGSLPDPSTKFTPETLHDFLYDAYATVPSRLPVIFFVNGEKLTPLFKSIGLRYNKYFHFGFIQNPSAKDLDYFQFTLDLPGMIVMVAEKFAEEPERTTQNYDFNIISYSKKKQGEMIYSNLIKFLYGVNFAFRDTLPGMNLAEEEDILGMAEEMELEEERFNVRYMNKLKKEIANYEPFRVKMTQPKVAKSDKKVKTKKSDSQSGKGKGKKKKEKKEKQTKEKKSGDEPKVLPEKYEGKKQFGGKKKQTKNREEL